MGKGEEGMNNKENTVRDASKINQQVTEQNL